jgi:excisionase family DNA binding protein
MMTDQSLDLFTTDEIADMLKVQPSTVRTWINSGKLPAIDLEGSYRIYRKDLGTFLAQRYKRTGQSEKKEE